MPWTQNYDPFSNAWLSTIAASTPVLVLFFLLAVRKTPAHKAAVYAFLVAALLAGFVFHMPWRMVGGAVAAGMIFAVLKIAWVVVAAVFVYEITVETGHFAVIQESIGGVTADRRLQVLLIAFAFGAVLEGAGGGGGPVAICGSMMVGLGFNPFNAAVLCLMANTAPVAFGAVGNPIRTLVAVTGLSEADISGMIGRILPATAVILPFWLIRSVTNWANTVAVWPGLLLCGCAFAVVQFYWSNFRDAGLVDIMGGMTALVVLAVFFKFWQPRKIWRYKGEADAVAAAHQHSAGKVLHAWSPFLLLSVLVVLWGMPPVKRVLDRTSIRFHMPGLHQMVQRVAPVVDKPRTEPAVVEADWLAAVGTATFLAGLIAGPLLGLSVQQTLKVFARTCYRMRLSVLAILAMLSLGYLTRYCGMDAIMGLAMTHTGSLFPFFGTLLGWLGVALSGTDAGSNALFGSLQVITANRLGLSPVLMAAANSAGGVMGKMISAQSVVVACAAVGLPRKEGDIFRKILPHSIALAAVVGLIVYFYAYYGQQWIPSGRVWK